MTDLSYTAWDEKKYPWPPPDGWYQASDGKWWPEGYGPPSDDLDDAVDETVDSTSDGSDTTFDSDIGLDQDLDGVTTSDPEPALLSSDDVASSITSPSEYDSSSPSDYSAGLAGWADAGGATTDVSGETPAEVDVVASRADADTTVESAMTRLDDLQRTVESQEFGVGAGAAAAGAGVAGAGIAGLAGGFAGSANDSAGSMTESASDTLADGDLSEFDLLEPDLVETDLGETDFSEVGSGDSVSAVGAAMPDTSADVDFFGGDASEAITDSIPQVVADSDGEMIDPTETLDIDPDELAVDTNPNYGQSNDAYEEQNGYESRVAVDHDGSTGYPHVRGMQAGQQLAEQQLADPALADPSHVDQRVADPRVGSGNDQYRPQPAEYGSTGIAPMQTAAASDAGGRRLLFGVLGLLALTAAGFGGYLLFQLQDDGDDAGSVDTVDEAAEAQEVDNQMGSFVNPHQPDKGVRVSVPVGETEQNDWMLEVRELASTTEVDDGNVELMITLRVRNDTPTESLAVDNLRFNLVTSASGDAIDQSDSCSAGGDLNRTAIIDPGKTEIGTVCWTVPAGEADAALLAVQSATASGRVHVQLS